VPIHEPPFLKTECHAEPDTPFDGEGFKVDGGVGFLGNPVNHEEMAFHFPAVNHEPVVGIINFVIAEVFISTSYAFT
jgi:hypothetical protein